MNQKRKLWNGSFIAVITAFFSISLFITSCGKDDNNSSTPYDVVYLQTNNFNDNQNAILAYRDKGNGNLEPLAGSPFLTKGSGVGNPMQILGPLDSDYEIRLSADKKFLLAVNSGSNTIAVFSIKENGSLEHIPGSPFASGGQTPVALDVSGNYVFVVNKSQDPLHATPLLPNYSTFTIDATGKLTPVTGAKFETTAGTSPSNALTSRDGKYVFGTDWLGFMLTPPVGTLRSFVVGSNGTLTSAPGSPYMPPGGPMPPDNGALGLWQHPSGNPLYVGLALQSKIAIYNINAATGALTFQSTFAAGAAACWIRTNAAGNHMYVLNSGDNTVQVYNTANAMMPLSIQTQQLKNTGPRYTFVGSVMLTTSENFSLHLSTNEKVLYVVSQHTNKDFSIGNYNYLHSLIVADDGTLTEPSEPIQLPVANNIRPKGSVVLSRQ